MDVVARGRAGAAGSAVRRVVGTSRGRGHRARGRRPRLRRDPDHGPAGRRQLGRGGVARAVDGARPAGAAGRDGPRRPVGGGAAPARPRGGVPAAPGAARPLRRAALPAGPRVAWGVPHQPVVRRPGLRRRRRRRPRHPGRGPAYERAVFGDLATPVLDDQVAALHAAAEQVGDLDLDRVAIRGWSFGGYLAALAVLRRPDVFHAAVAGAPVTDWRLYDTHYTERYLDHPDTRPDAYERSSILDDPGTTAPARPIMLVHGLADDNVVAAHTLRLSSALLAAGHPHTVLPLSGVTHMTPQEVVAENLLLLQVAFLRDALG
ncbi:prolyl oligopeptidase family serine peptidase [Actinomycetospora sp. CA-053990]|uniref:prolyl oligopeptidase family serine peptidase n=1 Tax=Actinomycetospora sp. CA-053990 TaxID=3239891 RepID=UPI003D8C9465